MKTWLRRNGLALVAIVLACVVIGATVTRPAVERYRDTNSPDITVEYGQSTTVSGVRWQLSVIPAPAAAELAPFRSEYIADSEAPPNSQFVMFVLRRDKDGMPAGLPPGYDACTVTSVFDGDRRWIPGFTDFTVYRWATAKGFTTFCKDPGPLLVALYVAADAHITAVDVNLYGLAGEDGSDASLNTWIRFLAA